MDNPLVAKLGRGAPLGEPERRVLDQWTSRTNAFAAKELVVDQSAQDQSLYVLVSGWACRFKSMPGQSRQIVGLILPGDHVLADRCVGFHFDYGVCTLTACTIAEVPRASVDAETRDHPAIEQALRWSGRVDEAILREWLAGLGRRSAEHRMAHLFCEVAQRLETIGMAGPDGYELPMTQAMLGDALGLSPAHVNRTLQALRARNLVSFENAALRTPNPSRLQKFAGFDPRYLNLKSAPADAEALAG